MADDDLNAFFDEVAADEAEVQQATNIEEPNEETIQPQLAAKENNGTAETPTSGNGEDDSQPPPSKKLKTSSSNNGGMPQNNARPRGVVVASSTPVISVLASISAASSNPVGYPGNTQTRTTPIMTPQQQVVASTPYPQQQQPPLPPGPPPLSGQHSSSRHHQQQQSKPNQRTAAGKTWVDTTLEQFPENDFRIFVGNIATDVSDQQLHEHFCKKYKSAVMARIIRDKEGLSKGFGFVSFLEPMEMAKALREMDQSWLSSHPIRVKRSDWKDREMKNVKKKQKQSNKKQRRKGW